MDDATSDFLLDEVRRDQLEVGARLAQGIQEHQAWQDLKHQLLLLAAQEGKAAAQLALPFLLAALKLALA